MTPVDPAPAPSAPPADRPALDRLFTPRSIAVIGATDRPGRIGTYVLSNIARNFTGEVYPVNPRGGTLLDRPVYSSIQDLPEGVDLAALVIPSTQVPAAIEQCAARGIGGIALFSAGFAEAGAEGQELQRQVDEIVARTGIRVLGPNCMGFLNGYDGAMVNFIFVSGEPMPEPGPVALVSQSGGFGSYILTQSLSLGVKLSWFISTGNESDVSLAEALAFVVERPQVNTVAMFAETLRNPEVFIRAARRAQELDKPIVLLKAGRSEQAARAAMSHTASVVGSADVLDAVCRQYGVIVVHSMQEMQDLCLMFQTGRRLADPGVGVMTASGGAGVLLADGAAAAGLTLPVLTEAEQQPLLQHMPTPFHGSVLNPIDTTAQLMAAGPGAYGNVLAGIADTPSIPAVAAVTWAASAEVNRQIVREFRRSTKPFSILCTDHLPLFQEAGVPTYLDPNRVMHALGALARFTNRPALEESTAAGGAPAEDRAAAAALLDRAGDRRVVLESDAKAVLALYGAPVTRESVVSDAARAQAAARALGGPVALKVMSYELPHKSDVGALRLGVAAADVPAAYADMLAQVAQTAPHAVIEGVLVQEMVPARLELTVGMTRDPVFGPVVAVGLGGVGVEIIAAAELAVAPFGPVTARRAISRVLDGRLVTARRGLEPAEVDQVAALMVAAAALAVDHPRISEIDINPVRVHSGRSVAADALIVLAEQDGGQS